MNNVSRFAAICMCSIAVVYTAATAQTRPAQSQPAAAAKQAPTTAPASCAAAAEVTEQVLAADGVIVSKLSNGLTVIVKPHRAAPVVSVRCYVHAGSLYERQWLGCGLSHLTEHLVAKDAEGGSSEQAGAKAPSPVTKIGGQFNASTSKDFTDYYISASSSKTAECIDVVAGWMAHADITAEDFEREHGVVQREREMGKDSPERQFYEAHDANLYGMHPAAVPVIGLAEPLAKLTYQDVLAYHQRMYVPSNMVFVVVGDVDPQAVVRQVCSAFGGCPAAAAPELNLGEIQTVTSTRRVIKPMREIKETIEGISFQSISLLNDDLYALDLLSTIMGEGQASRLSQHMIREKKLVTSIGTSSDTPAWGKGDFQITFRCKSGNVDQAEQAVVDELKAVIDKGVSDDELQQAKRQKLAELVHSRQTVDSIASVLAMDYFNTGDVAFSTNYVKRIQAVTAQQVRDAAAKYINFDRMVITRLVPADTFASAAASTQPVAQASTTLFTLPNGLRVILKPVPSAGLTSMAMVTQGGLMLESESCNGMGNLMAALSVKGAAGRSAEDINKFFARAGGGISAACANNSFVWQATVLEDSTADALKIFADAITRPDFPDKELQIIRPQVLAGIDRLDEDWQSQMMKYFRSKFYTGCPYCLMAVGGKEVVTKATPQNIREYYKQSVHAGDSVLAVYGSFDPGAMRVEIEKLFAAMPKGKNEITCPAPRNVEAQGELHVLPTKNTVAAVVVAVPGMTIDNLKDRLAIDVLDTIISGWHLPSGWLHEELRGKQLVYVVHAYNQPGLAPGAFITYAAGQPEKSAEVVEIIKKNLTKASQYKPTQQEIDQAVNTILTAELLDNQAMGELAMQAATDELFGLGYDFHSKLDSNYRKVTPDEVLRVAKKYLGQGMVVTVTTPKPDLLKKP